MAQGTTVLTLLSANNCRDLIVEDNRGEQLFIGLYALGCLGQIDLQRNVLGGALVTATLANGTTGDYVAGAFGIGGQRVYVLPDFDLVVAVTTGHYSGPLQSIIPAAILNRLVLPAIVAPTP